MEKKIRYTLGKNERLKSRKSIELLFREGKSFNLFPFKIIYAIKPAADRAVQAGFTVSSRHFKKAVERNRIKRLMREAWRLQKNELQLLPGLNNTILTVFVIYTGRELPLYHSVYDTISLVLKRLIKLNQASNSYFS